jgi:succinate dehydrogenase / fumarate reductase cytochrome b subunit
MSATERASKFRAWSTLGRKIITGITAMGLVIFIIEHLIGNLLLLSPNPEYYNAYAYDLMSWGVFLYIIEIGLLLFFLFHIAAGTAVYLRKRQARPNKYMKYQSTGGSSRQTISSKTMIWTGLLLLIFIVFHLITFKYNPNLATKYVTMIDGHKAHDFYHLVYDTFASGWITLWYVIIMVLLGYHLRHGFWSMFQSLGAMKPKMTPIIYSIGVALAIIIAFGFVIIPIWIHFGGMA